MNESNDELTDLWKQAKQHNAPTLSAPDALADRARAIVKHTRNFHLGNVAILLAVVVGLLAFFYYVAPLQTLLSHIGIGLMIGGLLVRIGIELYSVARSGRINLGANAVQATDDALSFYRFRKKIHGPITIAIVLLYSLGFYLLTPEFSDYFSWPWMMLIDGSYLVGAVILILLIRQGIRKEMAALRELTTVKNEMMQ